MDIKERTIPDPGTDERIEVLELSNQDELKILTVPDRAMDLYKLEFNGLPISYLNNEAMISPQGFTEGGAGSFSKHFFAGMMTTCGLIQSGRPCEEDGRKFGLHGCISNTKVKKYEKEVTSEYAAVDAVIEEVHPEGEKMQLKRRIILHQDNCLEIFDDIKNIGQTKTPFMMMYHINFGAPFLSDQLQVEIPFITTEDRDTGLPEDPDVILKMGAEGSAEHEKVYYTQADMIAGASLFDPTSGRKCVLTAEGEGLTWMGIWKNFVNGAYALGIEPCNSPGLGRVNAAKRGVLNYLEPGEERHHHISLKFSNASNN